MTEAERIEKLERRLKSLEAINDEIYDKAHREAKKRIKALEDEVEKLKALHHSK